MANFIIYNYLFSILFCATVFGLIGQDPSFEVEKALRKKLKTYDWKLRPVKNISDKISITIALLIRNIESLNEQQQTIQLHGVIFMWWRNDFFKWNLAEYNNTGHIKIEDYHIWGPDLTLFNTATGVRRIFKLRFPLVAYNIGLVFDSRQFSFSITCKFDFYNFPKDRHFCYVIIGSNTYDYAEVDLNWASNVTVNKKLEETNEYQRYFNGWEILEIISYKKYFSPAGIEDNPSDRYLPDMITPVVAFRLELQRHRPYFYMIEVLPISAVGLLTLTSFWTESQTVTFFILLFNLISQSILSLGLLNQLPVSAETVPKICIIYGFHFGLTSFSLIVHILLYQSRNVNVKLPKFVERMIQKTYQFKACNVRYSRDIQEMPKDVCDEKAERCNDSLNNSEHTCTDILPTYLTVLRRLLFVIWTIIYIMLCIILLS